MSLSEAKVNASRCWFAENGGFWSGASRRSCLQLDGRQERYWQAELDVSKKERCKDKSERTFKVAQAFLQIKLLKSRMYHCDVCA